MQSKAWRIYGEIGLAILLAIVLGSGLLLAKLPLVYTACASFPIVWLSYRRGLVFGLLASMVYGIGQIFCFTWLRQAEAPWLWLGLIFLVGPMLWSLAGLFARNVVRTAFNRQFFSTQLNIVVSNLLVMVAYGILLQLVNDLRLGPVVHSLPLSRSWLILGLLYLVTTCCYILLLRTLPNTFVPKPSRFLTRREQSYLLN